MAEVKEESKSSSEESVKLFVGQVPKRMTEDEVLAMFKEFALVDEVNIIRDKISRASRGSNRPKLQFQFKFKCAWSHASDLCLFARRMLLSDLSVQGRSG